MAKAPVHRPGSTRTTPDPLRAAAPRIIDPPIPSHPAPSRVATPLHLPGTVPPACLLVESTREVNTRLNGRIGRVKQNKHTPLNVDMIQLF